MKGKSSSIIWGILLLLAGGALLADRLGWIDFNRISTNVWVYVFAGASLLFLLIYFLNGVRNWGWLFPALIFAAISLTIWMADRNLTGAFMGMPVQLAIAIPFYVGFALDRKAWGLLIPAWVLTVTAFVTLVADLAQGTLIGAVVLYAAAAPFLVVFLLKRARWWALIPAWVLFVLGTITLLAEHVNGNLIGALFLYAVALPFLVVYLTNRAQRWALIPAIATAVVGTIPLLSMVVGGDAMGVAVMLIFSAPFFFVYFRWKEHWWALIPAGVFASIAVVVLLGMLIPKNQPVFNGILIGVMLLGFGLTFGWLWLRRASHPTAWARFPALGLFAAAVLACFLGSNTNIFWAVVLMAAGIALLAYNFLRKKPGDQA
jgi:hypothetical protein